MTTHGRVPFARGWGGNGRGCVPFARAWPARPRAVLFQSVPRPPKAFESRNRSPRRIEARANGTQTSVRASRTNREQTGDIASDAPFRGRLALRVAPARATHAWLRGQTGPMDRCRDQRKREQTRHTERFGGAAGRIRVRRRPVGYPGRWVDEAHPARAGLTRPTTAVPRSASKRDKRVKAHRRRSRAVWCQAGASGGTLRSRRPPQPKARANGTQQVRSGHPARPPRTIREPQANGTHPRASGTESDSGTKREQRGSIRDHLRSMCGQMGSIREQRRLARLGPLCPRFDARGSRRNPFRQDRRPAAGPTPCVDPR